jgi:hypothetical protein
MQVEILYTNETGEYVWAVQILGTDEWLDAFKTHKEAINYCKENGHEIISWGKRGIPNRY